MKILDGQGHLKSDPDRIYPGMIIGYTGARVPTGWALCDGLNGTPNLVDAMIVGDDVVGLGATNSGNAPPGNMCLDYDGSNDYATSASSPFDPSTTDFTLEAWLWVDAFNALDMIAVSQQDGGGTGRTWLAVGGTGGGAPLRAFTFIGGALSVTDFDLAAGQWNHLAIVHDNAANTAEGYVNATLKFTGTGIAAEANSGAMVIGASKLLTQSFNGRIDEVRIWNDKRTATEILDNMGNRLVGTEANLVAYWRMDEGTGTTVADDSPNSNTLTLAAATATPAWLAFNQDPTLAHLGFALADHSNHSPTQMAAHTSHAPTQPSPHANHSPTQPATHPAHASGGSHTHNAHTLASDGSVAVATNKLTGPSTHSADGGHTHDAHPAHTGFAVDAHAAHSGWTVNAHAAHAGFAVDAHSSHSITQPDTHSLKHYRLALIQKL